MSYPGRPCGGSFTPRHTSIVVPTKPPTRSVEEDFDTMLERHAQEFEQMEKQDDLRYLPEGATGERTAGEIGEVNMLYDPEGKNRTTEIPPKDRFRLLAFIKAQREKAEQRAQLEKAQAEQRALQREKAQTEQRSLQRKKTEQQAQAASSRRGNAPRPKPPPATARSGEDMSVLSNSGLSRTALWVNTQLAGQHVGSAQEGYMQGIAGPKGDTGHSTTTKRKGK